MANAATTPRSDVDPNFETQLKALRDWSGDDAVALIEGTQTNWMRPALADWACDPNDRATLGEPFDRAVANQMVVDATSDPTNAGVSGDIIVGTTQAHYLAVLERSFRVRHTMHRIRGMAHASAREVGHGDNRGAFIQCGLEYVRGLVAQAKAGSS